MIKVFESFAFGSACEVTVTVTVLSTTMFPTADKTLSSTLAILGLLTSVS